MLTVEDQLALGLPETTHRTAVLSEDGLYRYTLTRRWGAGRPVVFVMLNPSTADATVDDPTIVRCTNFARDWGYGALTVVNLYAYRATDPKAMFAATDPIGPDNDSHLREVLRRDAFVVVAWGAHARPREVEFFRVIAASAGVTVHALRVTKAGAPGHPLYIPAATEPTPYTFPPFSGGTS